MNEDRIQGKWKQLTGTIKEKWGKLTDDDLQVAEGNAEYLSASPFCGHSHSFLVAPQINESCKYWNPAFSAICCLSEFM